MKTITITQRTANLTTPCRRHDRCRRKGVYPSVPILTLLLALLLPACGAMTQPASTSTPVSIITPANVDLTPTLESTSTPTQTATKLPAAGLSQEGPWLLLNTEQGLWAANPDGTGGTLFSTGPVLIPGKLQNAVSSIGGHIAFLTYSGTPDGYFNYHGLKINILTMPQFQSFLSIPLTSPETEPSADNPSDIIRAMVEYTSFAWSPEGKRLAYIGAREGPSTDLYEYPLDGGGAALRLTDGPDQAYDPKWSPDGTWIVHTAAAGFGTGAGIVVTGFYAARADGGGVISLYDIPKYSGGEDAVGWLNNHTLVTRSWFITCGPSNLRLTDLSQEKSDVVFEGCLSSAAVAEGHGSVLFAQSSETERFDTHPQPGMYILTEADPRPRLVSNADIQEIIWSAGSGNYLARTSSGTLFEVSPTGDVRNLMDQIPQIPTVSPDGRHWAWAGSLMSNTPTGLWIGEYGRELHQITSEDVTNTNFLWAPDGQSIYFVGSTGSLFRAQMPDWIPTILAENLKAGGSGWPLAWVAG